MRIGLLNKKDDSPQLTGYISSLNRQIEDAAKMLTVVESDGWPLVQQLWQDFEARSQTAFLAGEITAEEHKAQLKAVRILVGGVEAIAANTKLDSGAKIKLRELETSKPSAFRRY
jgi:hypothetical protein